jgi:Holliday junction resolvase RusA-like endonuclease
MGVSSSMKIHFEVKGFAPPIKYGDKSMWTRPGQKEQVIELRKEAKRELGKRKLPVKVPMELEIEISIPQSQYDKYAKGDLDNYITGICDSLQKAHVNVLGYMDNKEEYIEPDAFFLIDDDKYVRAITATKNHYEDIEELSYRVTLIYEC